MSGRAGREEGVCEIASLNHDGSGVGHCDGKVVFVDGALPGEEVRFTYGRRKRRYDTGAAREILRAAHDRVVPRCPHFGVCGGCRLQHLDGAAQLRAKAGIVREAMAHIAKVDVESWAEPVASPVWGYRRKARLGVRVVPKKGGVLVGFRERQQSLLAPLSVCHTLNARLGQQLPALKALLERISVTEQIPQVEFAAGDETAALVFRHLVPLTDADVGQIAHFGETYGFAVYTQAGGPDTVRAVDREPAPLSYRLPAFDVELQFAPIDFVQINGETNRAMVSQAVDWLELRAETRVLDLFCGIGNFTLPIGRRARSVVGVEGAESLVGRARANGVRNGLSHIVFHAIDLEAQDLERLFADGEFDAALLDPPRTGALAAVKVLAEHHVPRLVYVSCNPATLARDADLLVHEYGYRLARLGVIDMFPHTHHVEAMALFLRES
ncbi:MAG TPA: 23S rRNA (uracil(1939)-C(5))-methyltransferase RlmD [Acidiferrobacter sp.]|nr:23S rRNA (uracil(1939)-C(5))-methyltransferase RlmD [Acidiferrobacter sp.]